MRKEAVVFMICKSDYQYFDRARRTALLSDYIKAQTGCVAVYRNRVIGIGFNCNKTHPAQKYYNMYREPSDSMPPKLHAEISCLNQIKHLRVSSHKVKIYIYRVRKDRPHGMARPCPSCMAALKDYGIRDIYYTTNDGYCYERIEI